MAVIVKISPSRWDTGSFHSADGHPSLFSFFSLRSLSLPCSPSSSSYRYPFASCMAFFALLLASLLSFAADNVFLPRCYTPPAPLESLQICVFPLCAVFLACFLLFIFLLFLPFFDFNLDVVSFHLVFFLWVLLCCLLGFCNDSFSV